jgi:hypothetical protein
MERLETLACRIERQDRRAFAAIARAADRTESAELRRLVRMWIRGELRESPATRPAEQERVNE